MKEYIDQFYTEGLATTFYLRPVKFLKKQIKNKKVRKVCIFLYSWFYTWIMLLLAIYVVYKGILIY